jgi:hypothetical protein
VQVLREGGCGGILPAAQPLHRSAQLDRAAEQWAAGRTPATAAERSGYQAAATTGLHINGPDSATVQLLRQSSCRAVTDRTLHDIGIYHHGADTWLLLASAYAAPAKSQAPVLALQSLQLVNEVRARGARCGERSFAPAPPVRLSDALGSVALGHASDMAAHGYFEHEDLAGHSPADRVRAAGYHEKLVDLDRRGGEGLAGESRPLRKYHGPSVRRDGHRLRLRPVLEARIVLGAGVRRPEDLARVKRAERFPGIEIGCWHSANSQTIHHVRS